MKRDINPYHLGGSLYIPATHKNLQKVLLEAYYPFVKSVIVDFEDAIYDEELHIANEFFETVIQKIPDQKMLIFVRPRDISHTKILLEMKDIEKIDGFTIAKCDTQNMHHSFKLLNKKRFWIMPVLESVEIFDIQKLMQIRDFFQKHQEEILTLRFGAEDLSSQLGIKRNCETILYDMPSLLQLLTSIVLFFKPLGFMVSAPVYTCFSNEEGFTNEVTKDLLTGLFGKTVIHPNQAKLINEIYKVPKDEWDLAQSCMDDEAKAIYAHGGMMVETIPHRRWAEGIIMRGEIYGIR